MKIKLLSDLHLEGAAFKYEYSGEDVLVLAGDIHTKYRHEQFLDQIPETLPVLFVAGNHEYYGSEFNLVNDFLKVIEVDYPNFHFLNNTGITIGDVEFFGGTMFTDFSLDGLTERWFALQAAKEGIADFHWIDKTVDGMVRRWSTSDHCNEHELFVYELAAWIRATEGRKRVVISHFQPHTACVGERFRGSVLNPYFTVDMTAWMGWPGLWLHGHGHESRDFYEGDTRVVCNPRGYGLENKNGFDPNLLLEI